MGKGTNGMDKKITLKKVVSKRVRLSDTGHNMDKKVGEVGDVVVDRDNKIMPAVQFPIEIFPIEFQEFVTDFATCFNVEPGLIASMAMTILSGAIGNTVKISAKSSYQAIPFLWLVVIARSGKGKSPPMDALMDYVGRLQSKTDQGSTITDYMTNDCSVPALADMFYRSGRGIIIHRDEISGLILGLDQYKGDRERYLELLMGHAWNRNRKNVSTKIPNTGAAIIGGIQPKILSRVFKDDAFDDGLFPRFLVYPLEERQLRFSREDISEEHQQYWKQLLDKCYGIPLKHDEDGLIKPTRRLKLDAEAVDLFGSFVDSWGEIELLLSDRAGSFMIKLVSYYTLKFAGLLHIINRFNRGRLLGFFKIDKETIGHAIKLTNFFAGQVVKMLKSYDNKASIRNEYEKELIKTLFELKDEVAPTGRLNLGTITDAYNSKMLIYKMNFTNKSIGLMLRRLGLETIPGNANRTDLLWERTKIESLFTERKLTKLTSLTSDSSEDDEATENHRRIPIIPKKIIVRKRLNRNDDENS